MTFTASNPGPGRPKGSKNLMSQSLRVRVERICDPIGRLMAIAMGEEYQSDDGMTVDATTANWSQDHKLQALTILARKIAPDLKAIAVANVDDPGQDGAVPIDAKFRIVQSIRDQADELAARIALPDKGRELTKDINKAIDGNEVSPPEDD